MLFFKFYSCNVVQSRGTTRTYSIKVEPTTPPIAKKGKAYLPKAQTPKTRRSKTPSSRVAKAKVQIFHVSFIVYHCILS